MMPPRLFKSQNFSGANLVTMSFYLSLAGVFFILPFNFIQIQGYTATEAGAAFIPFPLLVGGLSRWSGGIIVRFGARPLLVAGPIITSVGFILLGIYGVGSSYWINFFPGIFFMGLGVALSFAPMNTTVMSSVDRSEAGTASGVNKAVSRLSGMLSVALLGALAIMMFGQQLTTQMQQDNIPERVQKQMLAETTNLAKADIPEGVSAETRDILETNIRQSLLSSFRIVMFVSAGLVFLGAVCAIFMIDFHPESSDDLEKEKVPN